MNALEIVDDAFATAAIKKHVKIRKSARDAIPHPPRHDPTNRLGELHLQILKAHRISATIAGHGARAASRRMS